MLSGFGFIVISSIGILKFQTFLSRLHPSGVGETAGIVLMGIGFMLYQGADFTSAKIFLILFSLLVVNPVGTHLISKSAHRTTYLADLMATDRERIAKIKEEEKMKREIFGKREGAGR